MVTTSFTEMLGCALPLQQAPMGGVTTPELVAASAEAGAVGMFPTQLVPPDALADVVDAIAARTDGAFGITFLMPFFDRAALDQVAGRVQLVDFFYADPDSLLVKVAHEAGALASWQVGSRDEALAARDAGCDLIVVQGVDAGGRIRGATGTLALLSSVLDAVDVPVVAAGGIGNARAVAAVLGAGAATARVGTRLLATRESGAHPRYKDALVGAEPDDTVVTTRFSVMWPRGEEPCRCLASALDAADAFGGDTTGEMMMGAQAFAVPRFGIPCPNASTTGAIDAMALYAGQSVGSVQTVGEAAGEVLRELAEGADELLARQPA